MDISTQLPGIVINIPIIISLVAATRYIVGLKTWKNYPTMALALAFYFFYQYNSSLPVAIIAWVGFYALIIGTATYTRYAIRRMKMNFYARMSLIYLAGTVSSLLIYIILQNTGVRQFVLSTNTAIGIFLITTTIDEAATLLFKKGSQEYIRRMFATSLLGFIGGVLLVWPWWNSFITANPVILIIVFFVNIIIASWTALRFTEYLRFAPIIRNQK